MARAQRLNHLRPSGVVLISVLLIVSLLTALVYKLVDRHSLTIAQTQNAFSSDQTIAYAIGGESYARQILKEDFDRSEERMDGLTESWAQPLVPFEVENGGVMEIQIRDLNSCFNLNSLAANDYKAHLTQFKTLLRNLNIPDVIAEKWRDWVDADANIEGFGAEDGEYLLLENGYRTANRRAGHWSELRLLQGMEPEQAALLAPYVCTLPDDGLRLNINTASGTALASLNADLAPGSLDAFMDGDRAYTEVGDLTSQFPALVAAAGALGVTSEYFLVQIRAEQGTSITTIASILHRDPVDGAIRLISRDFGQDFHRRFDPLGEVKG
ncbi:MAG: type II secretion system minor pseudopilin GspK [Proteobacteria bacterium]|nr:type II secretion system minor pseudopilin GspK [Pseudomonadota bacterium]